MPKKQDSTSTPPSVSATSTASTVEAKKVKDQSSSSSARPKMNEYVNVSITVANIPYIALLIAFAYTMTSKLPVILGQIIEGNGKLDNSTPREQQARMTGFGSRADGAHKNAFEALTGFGIIVAVTLFRIGSNTDARSLELAASLVKESIFFVIARTIFQVWYPLGLPSFVRTIIWAFGWMSVLQLYINNATF
ncbi:hypothetical protein C9374_008524 [Naegleria lovaniensis]|uniref:MAPEG family protein n=1 Tax=Naegleria lovaniensis TaxID=51637 RepID=A0AA88GKW9_NAELO|nr:uncharacterized protein C9374_008524 [Naegleria lovaniensis]KAG2378381.1 hypothetical protein C9374_008524 [Naegleria lovaniensis]